jgi:hypothetical protein
MHTRGTPEEMTKSHRCRCVPVLRAILTCWHGLLISLLIVETAARVIRAIGGRQARVHHLVQGVLAAQQPHSRLQVAVDPKPA